MGAVFLLSSCCINMLESDETLEVLNYAVRYRSRRALEIWADIQWHREDSLEIDKSVPFA